MSYEFAGKQFGDLIVVEKFGISKDRSMYWKCHCKCGTVVIKSTRELPKNKYICTGHTLNRRKKHKLAYISWYGMKARCRDKKHKGYQWYGARGVDFCKEWESFDVFLADMGDPPIDQETRYRLTLDRIDNSKGYSKENCRWATPAQQAQNKLIAKQREGKITYTILN